MTLRSQLLVMTLVERGLGLRKRQPDQRIESIVPVARAGFDFPQPPDPFFIAQPATMRRDKAQRLARCIAQTRRSRPFVEQPQLRGRVANLQFVQQRTQRGIQRLTGIHEVRSARQREIGGRMRALPSVSTKASCSFLSTNWPSNLPGTGGGVSNF